ncbi:hypothetical protein K439DRAFT_31084 [Ramaria rubella]|nr:hypothetical protein K439DRAFT_31084 [Ramaria rubella]
MPYHLVMLGMIIYKAKQHFSMVQNIHFPLSVVLFRDGILYYILVIGVSLTILGFVVNANLPIVLHISALSVTLHSVFTKRLFLNLRSVASEDESPTQSWAPNNTFTAVPGLQFASTSDTSI